MSQKSLSLFLPCAAGVEDFLRAEVGQTLGRSHSSLSQSQRGGVALMGDQSDVMLLNLHSRLCQRVLIRMAHAPYRSELDIYEVAKAVEWDAWFNASRTFKIEITAQHSPLKSLNFAALRVKDAICDRFRDLVGERPSVDTRYADMRVYVHLTAEQVTLYLDTSGEPLFKRGWREEVGEAPLKETLAAAMLAAIGWEQASSQGVPLYDPCCGSGTIAIEAAQIACHIAPGLNRFFAFEKFDGFAPEPWEALRQEALARIRTSSAAIYASDVAHRMVDFAQRNAERAGPQDMVSKAIHFRGGDALQRMPPVELAAGQAGLLILNPPYGERIETGGFSKAMTEDGQDFFALLATHWKQNFAGWTGWILSPDLKLPTRMRLKESRRVPMWNGPIECRLFKFDMVKGAAREVKAAQA
ncbi:MAG: THUMP domain-containing protein [Cytophagales bacterium]|nr:THUMP domain-containing protein [Cytophagales bacterium]